MSRTWSSVFGRAAFVAFSALWAACQSDPMAPKAVQSSTTAALEATAKAAAGNVNGAAGQRPAYYDGELFTVNMKELPEDASAAVMAHNGSMNQIYASNDLDDEQDFISVIDAIQGDGFNPLWHQNLIVFNQGFTPHQFTSDEEVLTAAQGANPEITIVSTDEVYRCSVVGHK
jgi:hypothetical protein